MDEKLTMVKVGLGWQVRVTPRSFCVNPKVKQNYHVYCPNCNLCGNYGD